MTRRVLARAAKSAPQLPGLDPKNRISLREAATLLHCRASVKRLAHIELHPLEVANLGALTFTAYDRAKVMSVVECVARAKAAREAARTAGPAALSAAVAAAVAESGMPAPDPLHAAEPVLARQQFAVSCEIRDLLKRLVAAQNVKAA